MSGSRRRHDSWSNLPGPIIRKISKLLKTRDQILRFKRVCRKWRKRSHPLSVNILSLNLPLSIPISSTSDSPPFHLSNRPLVLRASSVYVITPSQPSLVSSVSLKPWMIMVQESNPGKLRLRHPLTAKRVNKFPSTLDMTRFRVSELAQGYNIKYSDCVHKVLPCSSASPSSLEFLVLYHKGNLGKLTVRIPESQEAEQDSEDDDEEARYSWKMLQSRDKRSFWFIYLDDVVEFKKMYCAVDRRGKLYRLDTKAMTVPGVLVSEPICRGDGPTDRRKRLVVDFTSGELHLVLRERLRVEKSKFTVYKFNEQCKRWDVLEKLGSKRVLFVGIDHSFFAKAEDFPGCKGNCIVFAANCFTQYSGRDNPDGSLFGDEDVEVGVYRLGRGDNFRLLSSAYPEFAKMIWPPPTWFACKGSDCSEDEETESGSSSQEAADEETSSSIKSLADGHAEGMLTDSSGESSSDDEKDEEMQLDSTSQSSKTDDNNGTTESEEEDEEELQRSSSSEQPCDVEANFSDEATKNNLHFGPLLTLEYEKNNPGTSKMNNQKNAEDLDSSTPNFHGQDFSMEKVSNANSTYSTPTLVPLACINCSSTVKFEGVDIKAELLPTLETIWVKQGCLISEATVRNKEIRACALELLAKLMISLQNTTGRSLTDSQANDIKSAMFDLQRVGLKVDWLTPIVDKALKLQSNKALIESMMLLDKKKAQVEKEEKEFLARNARVKQEIEEDMACLSARIPFPEIINLDDCLGGGLF